jgi:hypothetical protein
MLHRPPNTFDLRFSPPIARVLALDPASLPGAVTAGALLGDDTLEF